jgi:hypothetical protein
MLKGAILSLGRSLCGGGWLVVDGLSTGSVDAPATALALRGRTFTASLAARSSFEDRLDLSPAAGAGASFRASLGLFLSLAPALVSFAAAFEDGLSFAAFFSRKCSIKGVVLTASSLADGSRSADDFSIGFVRPSRKAMKYGS